MLHVEVGRQHAAALELAHKGRRADHVIEHGGSRLTTVRSGFFNAVERTGLGTYVPHHTKEGVQVFQADITPPHTIRHTVLTWLDEHHVETRRAAQLAGHKDERTTKKISTHSSPDVLKGAVDILDDAIEPLPKIEHKPLPEEPETTPKNGLCPNGTKEPTTMRLVPRLKKCGKSLINCHGAVERTRTSTPCGANPSS